MFMQRMTAMTIWMLSILTFIGCIVLLGRRESSSPAALAQENHRMRLLKQRHLDHRSQLEQVLPSFPPEFVKSQHETRPKSRKSKLWAADWTTPDIVGTSRASYPPYYYPRSLPAAVDHINDWKPTHPARDCVVDCEDTQEGVLEAINKILDLANNTKYARYAAIQAHRAREAQLLEAIRAKLAALSPDTSGNFYCMSTDDCPTCDGIRDELDCARMQGIWLPVMHYVREYKEVVSESEERMRAELEALIAAYSELVMPEDPLPSDYPSWEGDAAAAAAEDVSGDVAGGDVSGDAAAGDVSGDAASGDVNGVAAAGDVNGDDDGMRADAEMPGDAADAAAADVESVH